MLRKRSRVPTSSRLVVTSMRMTSADFPPTNLIPYIKLAAMSNKFFVMAATRRPTPIKGQAIRALRAIVTIPGSGSERA
jgi:hypothetical protein